MFTVTKVSLEEENVHSVEEKLEICELEGDSAYATIQVILEDYPVSLTKHLQNATVTLVFRIMLQNH